MTQLIENTPRRHALIATLSHFDDPTRVVVLSDQRESKDLFWLRHRAHRRTFLIDRGGQLEIDVTPAPSAKTPFLIVAESAFRNSAFFAFSETALFGLSLENETALRGDRSCGENDLNQFEKASGGGWKSISCTSGTSRAIHRGQNGVCGVYLLGIEDLRGSRLLVLAVHFEEVAREPGGPLPMIAAIAALLLQLQPIPAAPAALKLAPTAVSATISTTSSATFSTSSMGSPETADTNDSAPIHWNLKSVTFDAPSTTSEKGTSFSLASSASDKSAASGTTVASLKNVSLTDTQKQGISSVRVPDPEPTKPIQMPSAETLHPSRAWLALSFVQSSAATFDAYSTRQAIGHGAVESDPLMRPFAHSDALYGAIQVGPVILDYVARHMQRSESPFFRRTWWVPQSLATAGFLFSGVHNMGVTNSLKH
jgi:hypothetical protein